MIKNSSLEDLSHKEIRVLMEIQENPLFTYEGLAEKLGESKSTIYRIIKKLENPALEVPYFRIVSMPHLRNLNLENIEVFFSTPQYADYQAIYQLCEIHPYIWYYSKCYGSHRGVYVQFRIPQGTKPLIVDLLNRLKASTLIREYQILHFSTDSILTHPNMKKYNFDSLSWHFNVKEWFTSEIPKQKTQTFSEKNHFAEIKEWLQVKDLAILAELMRNTNRKNTVIREFLRNRGFDLSQSTFNRRLKQVQKYLVKDIRAEIHNQTMDLMNPVLIWGYAEESFLHQLYHRMQIDPVPFVSTFKADSTKFFWYMHVSAILLSDLMAELDPNVQDLHFYYIDFPKSEYYLPNYEAYDEIQKTWKRDKDYIIYDVIKQLEEKN